jgi:2-methylcitrate dehydratase
MDTVIAEMADFVSNLRFDDLPPDVVSAAAIRLADTVACAIGGSECMAARVGRSLATPVTLDTPGAARWLGATTQRTNLDGAGFVNSCMIRYLDFNDTYPGGHPSDSLGPVIALADSLGSSGKELLTAIVAGYELFIRLARYAQLREKGWDQGFGIGLATSAAICSLLRLDTERTAHALSITAVSIVPMRATRAGELSYWKGTATAYAARNAAFAALLAAEGITGPESPIDGRHGLKDLITGPFTLPPFGVGNFLTPLARIKYWPVEYNLQAATWAGAEFSTKFSADDLESIEIGTYWSAWHETASEPAKWDPQTRETADHSMPYILIRALTQGGVGINAFTPDQYLDPAVRPLMAKVSVQVDDDLEEKFPETVVLRATAKTRAGAEHRVEIVNPLGHEDNPLTPAQFSAKFMGLAQPSLGAVRSTETLQALLEIAEAEDVRTTLNLLNASAMQV